MGNKTSIFEEKLLFDCNKKIKYENGNKYSGEIKDNMRNGNGKMIYKENIIVNSIPPFSSEPNFTYTGEWLNDKRHGHGILENDDLIYDGNWQNDQINGYGKIKIKSNALSRIAFENDNIIGYDGEWKDNKFNGKGTIKYKCGKYYEGDVVNGKCDGYGVKTHPNGTVYKGEWKDDSYFGRGILISKYHPCDDCGISKFEGVWNKNIVTGIIILNNGDRYEGVYEIKNYRPRMVYFCGSGKIFFANGDLYDGSIDFGKLGNGEIKYKNGGFFKGTFKNNKYWCGNGIIYIEDEIYIGDFVDGILDGTCEIKYKSGTLKGIFDKSGCDGCFTSNNGETLNCRFRRTKNGGYGF